MPADGPWTNSRREAKRMSSQMVPSMPLQQVGALFVRFGCLALDGVGVRLPGPDCSWGNIMIPVRPRRVQ